jgi:hypothetical protein
VKFRRVARIALLAVIGLAPIVIAIALAGAEIANGFSNKVLSSSAAYAGDVNGQPTVVALVDASSIGKVRVGQPAQVFVPTLETRLAGRVSAVPPASQSLPPDFDPAWLAGTTGTDPTRLALIYVTLDTADSRLTPGTAVGVRISDSGS